ncbi:MAG: hypothetical protein L6Q54_13080 [Leptospiraceae bacterium]|nr:hypothetical protein [Leptospiraceae bacterium]MCK6382167.1 hypothetical protein [Leptospiraceae bacterium]NUM40988.1 hypothetical protein [Leptospiraceae bacterium]
MTNPISFVRKKFQNPYNLPGRPVITGIGIVSPIGIGKDIFWKNLLAGETGLDKITLFDVSSFSLSNAAEVKNFQPEKYFNERQLKHFPRAAQFASVAFQLAKEDASLNYFDPYRTDVVIGASQISFFNTKEESYDEIFQLDEDASSTTLKTTILTPAGVIANSIQSEGYVSTIASACSGGIDAIGIAAKRIRDNESDYVICGGVNTPITENFINAFLKAKMLTSNEESPDTHSPIHKKQTKPYLGEGSVVFIVEDRKKAIARNAKIYAEIASFSKAIENTNRAFQSKSSTNKWKTNIPKTIRDKIPTPSVKEIVGREIESSSAFQIAIGAISIYTGITPPTCNYFSDSKTNQHHSYKIKNFFKSRNFVVHGHDLSGVSTSILLKDF